MRVYSTNIISVLFYATKLDNRLTSAAEKCCLNKSV